MTRNNVIDFDAHRSHPSGRQGRVKSANLRPVHPEQEKVLIDCFEQLRPVDLRTRQLGLRVHPPLNWDAICACFVIVAAVLFIAGAMT